MAARKTTGGNAREKVAKKPKAKTTAKKVAKKAVPKKPKAKTTAKKVAKKAVPKKPKAKTAPKKVAKKTSKTTATKNKRKKVDTSDNVLLKKKTTNTEKDPTVSVDTTHRVGIDENSVTIFSRVKTDHTVLLVARVLGLVFVLFGTLSMLFGLSRSYEDVFALRIFNSVDKQIQANTINGTLDTTISTDPSLTSPNSGTGSINEDPKPKVTFSFPTSPVSKNIELLFTVPYATGVFIRAHQYDTGQSIDLGPATSQDGTIWKRVWNTEAVPDGEYKISAYISNTYGSYVEYNSNKVIVENNTHIEPSADTSVSSTTSGTSGNTSATQATTDTSSQTTTATKIDVKLSSSVPTAFTTDTKLVFSTQNISSLIVGLYNSSGVHFPLGSAKQVSADRWEIPFLASKFTPGKYLLKVVAYDSAGKSFSQNISEIYIEQKESSASSTTTTSVEKTSTSTQTSVDSENETLTTVEPVFNYEKPEAKLSVGVSGDLSGNVPLIVSISNVSFAEFYARPENSLKDIFIGLGSKVDASTWRLLWNTKNTPNGKYKIFSKLRSPEGYFFSDSRGVTIVNPLEVAKTETELTYISNIQAAGSGTNDPVADYFQTTTGTESSSSTQSTTSSPRSETDFAKELMYNYEGSLMTELKVYTIALRDGDEEAIARSERRLAMIQEEIAASVPKNEIDPQKVNTLLSLEVDSLKSEIKKTETIVRERVGDAVVKDSDGDGITDYDEVTLYKTDPFVADSDKDGFTDGAEIEGGFDPNNASQEAVIVYESPKETGVTRDDILLVENITTDVMGDDTEVSVGPVAFLSGKGLPNSFVTLYIFSTPTIITVKTSDDGSWNYRFDKELEDGEHVVFVGMTDNAGKIVAKSSPFAFVKEAQAFTPVDVEAAAGIVSDNPVKPTLFDSNSLLVALGGVVMALGFILLMVSLFVSRQRKEQVPELVHG